MKGVVRRGARNYPGSTKGKEGLFSVKGTSMKLLVDTLKYLLKPASLAISGSVVIEILAS